MSTITYLTQTILHSITIDISKLAANITVIYSHYSRRLFLK